MRKKKHTHTWILKNGIGLMYQVSYYCSKCSKRKS